LAAHRAQFLIIKKRAGPQAGAVKDDRLRQPHDFFSAAKLSHHDAAAGDIEITQQRREINGGLDQHRAELLHKRISEVTVGVAMKFNSRIEIVASGQLVAWSRFVAIENEGIDPAHAVFGADQQLKRSIRNPAGLKKLFIEFRGSASRIKHRRRRPVRTGDV